MISGLGAGCRKPGEMRLFGKKTRPTGSVGPIVGNKGNLLARGGNRSSKHGQLCLEASHQPLQFRLSTAWLPC